MLRSASSCVWRFHHKAPLSSDSYPPAICAEVGRPSTHFTMPQIGGFAVYLQSRANALRKRGKRISSSTFAKKYGRIWRNMSNSQREKYNRRARSRSRSTSRRRLKRRKPYKNCNPDVYGCRGSRAKKPM